MDEQQVQPWDRLENETPNAYAKFLTYRALGPARTYLEAYRAYKRDKTLVAPSGSFQRLGIVMHWQERAVAWDIHQLSDQGTGIVVNWVNSLVLLSDRTLQAIIEQDLRPTSLDQALRIIDVLSQFVTPETVAAAREFAAGYFARQRTTEPETG